MVAKFVLFSTKLTSRKVQYFGQFVIESLGRLKSWLWITLQWWKSYLYPICIKIWEAMKFYIKRNRYALKVQKGKKKSIVGVSHLFSKIKKNKPMVCLQGTLQFPYSLRSLLIFIKLFLIYHFLYAKTRSLNGDYR